MHLYRLGEVLMFSEMTCWQVNHCIKEHNPVWNKLFLCTAQTIPFNLTILLIL